MSQPVSITGKPIGPFVEGIITEILAAADLDRARVTSVQRTPWQQALAMYGICKRHGADHVRRLYKAPGKAVVDVYSKCIAEGGRTSLDILKAMREEIDRQGPENVSLHCSDKMYVIDLAQSLYTAPELARLIAAAKAHCKVKRVLHPPADPESVHLEIEKPEGPAVS